MKTYELINHTADTGVKAYGECLKDVFENAAIGMRDIMVDPGTVRPVRRLDIEVEADDIELLLAEWLGNLIYLFETQGFIPLSFKVVELETQRMLAEVHGEHYKEGVHELRTGIKAVTHHMLAVRKNDGWSATVVFDV